MLAYLHVNSRFSDLMPLTAQKKEKFWWVRREPISLGQVRVRGCTFGAGNSGTITFLAVRATNRLHEAHTIHQASLLQAVEEIGTNHFFEEVSRERPG